MMATLDTTPAVVDVTHYGGDTLTIEMTVPAAVTAASPDWSAQLRQARDSPSIDAEFTIIPPEVPGGLAYLVLDSATTSALVAGGAIVTRRREGRAVTVVQYTGLYDCQVSDAGSDPVRTLIQGLLTIEMDVTRLDVP